MFLSILLKKDLFYLHMGISVCRRVHVCVRGEGVLEEDIRSCGAVVTAGSELPVMCDVIEVFISFPVLT